MRKFGFYKNNVADGYRPFYNLSVNEVDVFDEYSSSLELKYKSQLLSINAYINQLSHGKHPPKKWRKLNRNISELKTRDLRVYILKLENGLTICLGGMKKNQARDIAWVRNLHKEIVKDIKSNGPLSLLTKKRKNE